jgi:hypothetical protein
MGRGVICGLLGSAAFLSVGAAGHYQAGLLPLCRAGPPDVLGWRPKPGTIMRVGLARARNRPDRAGFGPGQKIRLMGELPGLWLHGHL